MASKNHGINTGRRAPGGFYPLPSIYVCMYVCTCTNVVFSRPRHSFSRVPITSNQVHLTLCFSEPFEEASRRLHAAFREAWQINRGV